MTIAQGVTVIAGLIILSVISVLVTLLVLSLQLRGVHKMLIDNTHTLHNIEVYMRGGGRRA